ncbi:MAG: hypothetical protein GY870_06450 [archaeon]|nr:hypothetical protein [archaeon]
MKGYCPNCEQEIDETEYMQFNGLCIECAEKLQEIMMKKNIGNKEVA